MYLYFDIDDQLTQELPAMVFAVVEYFDDSPGGRLVVEYDSTTADPGEPTESPEARDSRARFRLAGEYVRGGMRGSQQWQMAAFRLKEPRLRNAQAGVADFRVTVHRDRPIVEAEIRRKGWPVFIRSVRLTQSPPLPPIADPP
jgi:hypothetical protein